jgi:hypothetical protein
LVGEVEKKKRRMKGDEMRMDEGGWSLLDHLDGVLV